MSKNLLLVLLSLSGYLSACRLLDKSRLKSEPVEPETWFHGHATYSPTVGELSGGCGVPQTILEWPHYVALNVQHTPRDYTTQLARPIQKDTQNGAWDRGRNCGRFVRVELLDTCIGGNNSDSAGSEFCAGGTYVADSFNGATLDFVVADSCQDGNLWCRDDRYHLDFRSASLGEFKKSGAELGELKKVWTNRKVRWRYVDAPNYTGDIEIGFLQNAKREWAAIVVTHLPRGIHGVEAEVRGEWVAAKSISDQGQAFQLPVTDSTRFKIRVIDAYDQPLQHGRIYSFELPCQSVCTAPYTKVDYLTQDIGQQAPVMPASTNMPAAQPSQGMALARSNPESGAKEQARTVASKAVVTEFSDNWMTANLQAELSTKKNWQDGYCVDLNLRNAGDQEITSWSLVLKAGGSKIEQAWNIEAVRKGDVYLLKPATTWGRRLAPGETKQNMGFCASLPVGREAASIMEIGR